MSRHGTAATPAARGLRPLRAALLLAWLPTAALLARGLWPHSAPLAALAVALFAGYYALRAARRFRGLDGDRWRAAPLLVFTAPLGLLAGRELDPAARALPPQLAETLLALVAVGAAHLVLLFLERADDRARTRLVAWALTGWLLLAWLGSFAQQAARFWLFQRVGHPEDTAFLYDCFRSWAAGGPLLSPWASAWGHDALRGYFGLHFSPIVLPVFALAKLRPGVATLLLFQNLFLAGGLALWARVLARQAARGRSATGTPLALWFLALLAANPTLNASLRNELHPLLWSLPALAWLHDAWLRRARLRFALAAAALFLFREDLGLVLAAYAPLSWLAGRRPRGDLYWLLAPLAGLPATAFVMFSVMPRFGQTDPAFLQRVFATTAGGFLPFLLGLLAQPRELLARLLRPSHLLVALRLALTGIAIPRRNWLWLPGLPLLVLFGLVGRDMQMLRLDSHYAAIPVLYLVAGGLVALWEPLRRIHPRRRDLALTLLWAFAATQSARLLLPTPEALRHPARFRAEVLADLRAVDLTDRVWVPVELMIATPHDKGVPAHRLVLDRLDPSRPGLPAWAILPHVRPETRTMHRLLTRHYALTRVVEGTRYDLYRLAPTLVAAEALP